MGVEPTIHPAKGRIAGFEDREDHRTPCASVYEAGRVTRDHTMGPGLPPLCWHSKACCISNPILILPGAGRKIGGDLSGFQFFAVFRPAAEPVLIGLLSDLVTDLYLHIAIGIAEVLLFDQ